MTLKAYLWGMRVSTFFALAGLIFVIYYIDPDESGLVGKLLFYLSALLSFSGIFTLFLVWVRSKKMTGESDDLSFMGTSFRQGVLLSLLLIILLFMKSIEILLWWDGMLVAAGIFLIELYFLSHKK